MAVPLARAANLGDSFKLEPMTVAGPGQLRLCKYFSSTLFGSEIDPDRETPTASKIDFFASSLTSSERSENFNCVEKFVTCCVSNGKSDEICERSVMVSPNIFELNSFLY